MKMQQVIPLLLCFLLAAPALTAQEESPEELFEDGDFFYVREDYEEAAYLYRQLLQREPDNANVHFKLGMAYLNIPGQEEEAIPHFLKATEDITLRYRKNRYQEKQAPHHTWFYLGNAYRINNQLEEALNAYEMFRDLKNFEREYNARITEEEVKAVERAKIIQDAPLDLYSFIYQEPINSEGSDYSAVISANESMLVWVTSQKFYEAILMSVKQDGKWTEPVNITPQVGSDGNMFPTGLSPDGRELLMVKRGELDSDIYLSRYDGQTWSKAEPVHGDLNSNFTEDHASFGRDASTIYLSSERRGSVGGLDIFMSKKRSDGTWSEPVNLGETINTEKDETSAYISPDGSRLIFASKGHFNMGGYDIFFCDIDEEGSYSTPVNIGYPINTTNDNSYFVPVKSGQSGVYARRHEEGLGNEDLWFIEIIPFEETMATSLTRLSEQNFTIELTDQETGEVITLEYDAIRDAIEVRSEEGKSYSVVYSREEND